MKLTTKILAMAVMAFGMVSAQSAQATVAIGEMAPAFTASDIEGHEVSLGDLKGKTVVLEWTNSECPFVKKHYDGSHNMQDTQKTATDDGVVWISINSSADGKQGHSTADEAKAIVSEKGAHPTHVILDPAGDIGHSYDAKTTPHMFVIDAEGKVAYAGAIDDNSSFNPEKVEGAKNYVLAALADLKAGHAVTDAQTQPYGCAVKY